MMPNTADIAAQAGVRVKQLEWVHPTRPGTLTRVITDFGVYRAYTHAEANGRWFWSLDGYVKNSGEGDSEKEVQAAAQADFEARILAEIEPQAVAVEVCTWCKGTGAEADYVGYDMKCVPVDCSKCNGTGSVTASDERAVAALQERLSEAEAIIGDRNDELALIDWISDKIGLPKDEELTRENFASYLAAVTAAPKAQPVQGWQTMDSALRKAIDFIEASSGEALGIAMSGSNHPNPDEVLMERFRAASSLIPELRGALAAAPLPAGPFSEETAK